ncbi:hypothetical protein [Citrobacter cronae]|uniref:hypothetical protein n=1 Tax=Citrobacter cronae TaxID=1748967 RepID=UPI001C11875D|nr:hypothetical protein [Citrobacter cronae]MBU5388906.1 hypothetical protein [Citrobacter cronae]
MAEYCRADGFPLAGAFTPAIAGVNHELHFLQPAPGAIPGQQTTVYTLTTGGDRGVGGQKIPHECG